MVRTQIQLPDEMHKRLRHLAAERGVSMAALIREAAVRVLQEAQRPTRDELWKRSLEVVGKFKGGASDIAERHDDYLEEAYSHDGVR